MSTRGSYCSFAGKLARLATHGNTVFAAKHRAQAANGGRSTSFCEINYSTKRVEHTLKFGPHLYRIRWHGFHPLATEHSGPYDVPWGSPRAAFVLNNGAWYNLFHGWKKPPPLDHFDDLSKAKSIYYEDDAPLGYFRDLRDRTMVVLWV